MIIQYSLHHSISFIIHHSIFYSTLIQPIIIQTRFMCSFIILVPLNHSILYHSNIRKIIQYYVIQNSLCSYDLYPSIYRIIVIQIHSLNVCHSLLCHTLCVAYYHSTLYRTPLASFKHVNSRIYLDPSYSFNILS